MSSSLSVPQDSICWYHHLAALPLKALSKVNIGPFGGENSVSVIIEAILAQQKGQQVEFPLSKTEQFFINVLAGPGKPPPDPLIEYRRSNHTVQSEVLRRWGEQRLGVIWLGGGVFTLDHPLISACKPTDWHIWTDAHPKVIRTAQQLFDQLREHCNHNHVVYDIRLPQEVDKLNHDIQFLAEEGAERIILQAYGLFYVMTHNENLEWMRRLVRPQGIPMSFIFNSMLEHIDFMPGVLVAFHDQRMVYYERDHIQALLDEALPGSQIVWSLSSEETRFGAETWLIDVPPA